MHTQDAESTVDGETSLGAAAKQVAEHASALARLELELAKLEVTRKIASLGKGIAFGLVAAVLLLFMLGFLLAAGAAALATTISTWLALLLVAGGLLVVAGLLALLALRAIKKGTPPVPEQAIREAKLTSDALKADGGT
jgi:protein-S-isoprenylcysteine O-methyltransferase Ste14